jgi:hypothetical protein
VKTVVREILANVQKLLGKKVKEWNIEKLKVETEKKEYERILDCKLKNDGMERNTEEEWKRI